MAVCSRCGASFDERRYLVLVPGADAAYDRWDCADTALPRRPRQLLDELQREVEHLRRQRAQEARDGESARA